jgi:hypothetical protein
VEVSTLLTDKKSLADAILSEEVKEAKEIPIAKPGRESYMPELNQEIAKESLPTIIES